MSSVEPTAVDKSTSTLFNNTEKIPLDPRVIKGTLSNGIPYIIRQNSKPEKRAELRLAIDAGSILEDDNQQGFAHLVEHMAFNGTKDFAKQEIVDYVESIGMKFGAHLNAHTGFDETVYKLQMPSEDIAVLEKGVHILENWAHKISFDGQEIDKERGVVLEELRRRHGANNRVFRKQLPALYTDSHYANRLPIGQEDILLTGSHENLKRFYHNWYRPELMSLVAVGDFEPEQMVQLFEKYFGQIKIKDNKPDRTRFGIPDNTAPLISIETDPELTYSLLKLQFKQPKFVLENYQDLRLATLHKMFTGMLNARIVEGVLKPESPVIAATSGFGSMFGDKHQFYTWANVKPNQSKQALAFLQHKLNQVLQHGFTKAEFERQKSVLLNQAQRGAKEVDKQQSRGLANQYVNHLMNGGALIGREHYLAVLVQLLPQIELTSVNQLAQTWLQPNNRLASLTAPETQAESLPTKAELLALWQQTAEQNVAAYQETKIADSLMTTLPTPGTIVDKQYDAALDYHIWTLSNGVKVIVKSTDFKNDQIVFQARSWGGFSLADNTRFKQVTYTGHLSAMMGLGDFNLVDLRKFNQGKSFKIKTKINQLGHKLGGDSSVNDLPFLMQSLYLKFQAPRKDQAAFDTFVAGATPHFDNQFNSPNGFFKEQLRLAQYSNNERSYKMDGAAIKQQDLAASMQFYRQLYSNPADFHFTFVGNIDLAEMETLVNQYLASIPSKAEADSFIERPDMRTKGTLKVTVNKGVDPKATIILKTFGQLPWSRERSIEFSTMKSTLSTALRERIREDKSGAYHIKVSGGFSRTTDKFSTNISFTCDPARVDELKLAVFKVIEEFKQGAIEQKFVNNFIEQQIKKIEVNRKSNHHWAGSLLWRHEKGITPYTWDEKAAAFKKMTIDNVQQAAKLFFNQADSVEAILLPEQNKLNAQL